MNKNTNKILAWGASFLGGVFLGYGIVKLLTPKKSNYVKRKHIRVERDVEKVLIIPKGPLSDDSMTTEPIHTSEPDEENMIIIKLPIIKETEEEELIEPTEPIELGETKPQPTKARSRKELPPVEVIMQMKEMLDNGATYKTIIETVGSEYELKYPYQVRNAINSMAQYSLT